MMPITTGQAAASFLKYLAEPAARSLALGCLAAIGLAAFRVRRVPLRLLVWTTTLYAALAMPFLGAFLPRMTVRVPAQTVALAQSVGHSFAESFWRGDTATMASAKEGANVEGEASRQLRQAGPQRDVSYRAAGVASAARGNATTSVASGAAHDIGSAKVGGVVSRKGLGIAWRAAGLGSYFAVTMLFFARLFVGMFFSWRLERASEEIHEREANRLARMRACMGGLESTPRLAETKMLSVPATLGVLHPVILLPTDWREWDEAKLDAILAHEVSHVARRDALTQRLSLIHRAIFWFSPLAWWIDRQITELAEEASDEAALAGGADQARYAETLLGFFAELEAAPGRIHWEGLSMANGCRAERRVERILSWKRSQSMKKWLAVMIVAVAAPLIFVVGAAHPLLAQEDSAPKKAENKLKPGGPVAPALPNAPKDGVKGGVASGINDGVAGGVRDGVVGPAIAPAHQSGIVGPANMTPPAPGSAPTVAGPAVYEIRPTPALMPVPGAPAHPPIVPGSIANGPAAPSAMTAPATASVAEEPTVSLMSSMTPVAPTAQVG